MKTSLVVLLLLSSCVFVAAKSHGNSVYSADLKATATIETRTSNLFREILERKDQLHWDLHEGDSLPSELCKVLSIENGSGKLPFKIFGFPVDIPGEQEDSALVLSWAADQNKPDYVMLATTTDQGADFFLLSSDGTLLRAAHKGKSGPWALTPNAQALSSFEHEQNLWHTWLKTQPNSNSQARNVRSEA